MIKSEILGLAYEVLNAEREGNPIPAGRLAWKIIGVCLADQERVALELIEEKGKIRSRDLAERLNVGLNHAGAVLLVLKGYGLVEQKSEGGAQYWSLAEKVKATG